jgi:cytidylate kinase
MNPGKYSIAITGEWPGAGQTTTAKVLATKLGLVRVYAGFLFRKFAYIWDIQQKHQAWNQFERSIAENTFDIDSIPFDESDFNQQTLSRWQNQLQRVKNMDMWDKILEQQSQKALSKPGVLVEAKLAVVLDQIDLGLPVNFDHRIIKILLTCPPKITAKRIIQRKIDNHEIVTSTTDAKSYSHLVSATKKELMEINLNDWRRYEKIYHIKREAIYGSGIHQIDTSSKNEQEVANAVIDLIQQQTK